MFRKYLLMAGAISAVANVALWFAWRKAEVEQDVIREEVQSAVLEASNARLAETLDRQADAFAARESALIAQRDAANAAVQDARARELAAAETLSDFVTEQQDDETSLEWRETPLPSSVVARLKGLLSEPTTP